MNPIKNTIFYKKLLWWFKIRKNKENMLIRRRPRKPLFYLRSIRYWVGKIMVRHRDSLRSSLPHRTRVAGQPYNHTIKRNQRRSLLHAQIPESGTKSNHSVGGSPHLSSYQNIRKTILPTKNRLQGISWSSQQQSSYGKKFTRLLSYVLKNTPLIGKLPFLGRMLKPAVRESSLSNLITSFNSSKQELVFFYYPIWLVKDRIYEPFQEPQLKRKPLSKLAKEVWDNSNRMVKYCGVPADRNNNLQLSKSLGNEDIIHKDWEECHIDWKDPDHGSKDWGVATSRNYRTQKYTYLPHEFGHNTPIRPDTTDELRLLTEAFSKKLLNDSAYKDQLELNERNDIADWCADPLPESQNISGIRPPTGCEIWNNATW